jgi:predicted Zn-dependent peptidase
MKDAEKAIQLELEKLQQEIIPERELQKVKNRVESLLAFEDMSLLNRANNLAFYELLGDAELMNKEFSNYEKVTAEDLHREAQILFDEKNSNTIYYYAEN